MGMHKGFTHGAASVKNDIGRRGDQDKTLSDYIARKQESDSFFESNDDHRFPKKKLTFEEWWDSGALGDNPYSRDSAMYWAYHGWQAAQENK